MVLKPKYALAPYDSKGIPISEYWIELNDLEEIEELFEDYCTKYLEQLEQKDCCKLIIGDNETGNALRLIEFNWEEINKDKNIIC